MFVHALVVPKEFVEVVVIPHGRVIVAPSAEVVLEFPAANYSRSLQKSRVVGPEQSEVRRIFMESEAIKVLTGLSGQRRDECRHVCLYRR